MRVLALFGFLVAAAGFGETQCPENIQYKNGTYLKRGANFYYQNGGFLLRGANLYYPNGSFLKREANVYYANGSYLQRGTDLYYPNGSFLKRGENYYYANGSFFKRDTSFYYENGSYARRNGKLYRPDGTATVFPVWLSETISSYGRLTAEVKSDSEWVDVDFRDLVVDATGTHIDAIWTGATFADFDIVLNTGVPGEDVLVLITPTQTKCSLGVQ